jgi:hypothetical protein
VPRSESRIAPRSVWLALVWALIAALPLAMAGLGDETWEPAAAFTGVLGLAVTLLPLLWVSVGALGARERAYEAVLLLAAGCPALTLSLAFTGVNGRAAILGTVFALSVLSLIGWLLMRSRKRGTAFALGAAWLIGAPLGVLLWADLAGAPRVALAPVLGLTDILAGRTATDPFAVLALIASLAGALEGWRWLRRRRVRALPAGGAVALGIALGLTLVGTSVAQPEPGVRAVLGPHVRQGETYPLRVQTGADDAIAARSYRQVFRARHGGGAVELTPTPVGSGRRIEVVRRGTDQRWMRIDTQLPEATRISPQTLLVGTLGAGVARLAETWFPPPGAIVIPIEVSDLPLLARAGEAVDVIVMGRGLVRDESAPQLRAWAAAGGALLLTDSEDLSRAAESKAVRNVAAPGAPAGAGAPTHRVRPMGAGLLVGPLPGKTLAPGALPAPLVDRLRSRLRRRARRGAIQNAVFSAPAPRPSRSLGKRAAFAALAAAVCLALLAPFRSRTRAPTFVAGAAAAGILLAAALNAVVAPSVPVYARSLTVLEAPAGARVAGRVRLLTVSAIRPTQARVALEGRAVPRPVFAAARDGMLAELNVLAEHDRGPLLDLPLGRGQRTFLRQDAADLGGSFHLTRGTGGRKIRIENRSPHRLTDAFALIRGGLYPLTNLDPGESQELDLLTPPIPFRRWRLSALDRATQSWRRLVTAALSGRDLEGSLLLIGRIPGEPQALAGVTEEDVDRPLLVISASQETR